MKPSDYARDTDDGDVFTIMVGGSTLEIEPGEGLVLLDENGDEEDGGTIEELTEGFSGPRGFAPASSTLKIRRWDSFKPEEDSSADD